MAVEIAGDSPQAVAFRLMEAIATSEGKSLSDPAKLVDRDWILETYRECIAVVLSENRWGPWGS